MTQFPEEYETLLLSALLRDEELFLQHHTWLCQDPRKPGEFFNDFDDVVNYHLYRLFYVKFTEFGVYETPTEATLRTGFNLLRFMSPKGAVIQESQLEEVYKRLHEITGEHAVSDADIEHLVKPAINDWIANKRLQKQIIDVKRSGILPDISERVDYMADTRDLIYAGAVNAIVEELQLPDPDAPTVDRIHLSLRFKFLNDNLGGGLGRKEHILFAAPSGQGKTVMACQLAGELALQGKHVLFVSTEQPSVELTPRIFSHVSTYPGFVAIKKKDIERGYATVCTDAQKETMVKIQEKLKPYLHFSCWVGDNSKMTISDLDGVITNVVRRCGHIDCIILDWIGGSLDGHTIDQGEKRQLYIDAANKMRALAHKFNCAAISFCQTTADGYDKMYVETKHLGECKAIHHGCVAAFGISALKNKQSEVNQLGETYAKRQYINCFKARNSIGTITPVDRDFDYARFVPFD